MLSSYVVHPDFWSLNETSVSLDAKNTRVSRESVPNTYRNHNNDAHDVLLDCRLIVVHQVLEDQPYTDTEGQCGSEASTHEQRVLPRKRCGQIHLFGFAFRLFLSSFDDSTAAERAKLCGGALARAGCNVSPSSV